MVARCPPGWAGATLMMVSLLPGGWTIIRGLFLIAPRRGRMSDSLFTADCKATPYWWDGAPLPALPEQPLPAAADVVVVGSGYTGLCAALVTARAGRGTVVFDAGDAGWGCSTRNGGQIGTSLKPGFAELAAKHGAERARAILEEGLRSLAWIGEFVAAEHIDCDFRVCGKFVGAHNPRGYERLGQKLESQVDGLEIEAHLVPRAEQHAELGTDLYHGGAVYPTFAALDPAKYHRGLIERVLDAGATVIDHCRVTTIGRDGDDFRVATSRGTIKARDVIVASNGYTGALTPRLRRRVIPIGSYIIATEPLPREQMDRLIPRDRMLGDTRRLVFYYRASPDRARILFGGRVSLAETDPFVTGPRLHAEMVRIFPELVATRISHSWVGFVAYTFDTLPHLGRDEGIYYAMGYCGSGVGMASYLGTRVGQQLLGLAEGRTGFDGLEFETRPFYTGKPWFLAPSVLYYRWRDRLNF